MFELPVCVSYAADLLAVALFFSADSSRRSLSLSLNPLRSVLLLVLLAGLRALLFLPFVWRYLRDDLLVPSQRPSLWHALNVAAVLLQALAELLQGRRGRGLSRDGLFVWLVIAGSLLSVYCQSVALKQLVSTALPARHLVLGLSLPPAASRDLDKARGRDGVAPPLDLKTGVSSRASRKSSDRLLANRVASYYTESAPPSSSESNSQLVQHGQPDNSEFLHRFREQLDVAHSEWNMKIVKLKESISNFGTDNSSFSRPDTVVFEELLLLFATNSNNPDLHAKGTSLTSAVCEDNAPDSGSLRAALNPNSASTAPSSINTKRTILRMFANHPKTLEFYIPQLVVYLLYGYAPTSAELREALLTICEQSAMFAHRIFYFIEAYCIAGAGVTFDGVNALKQLLQGIERAALRPADLIACGHGRGESGPQAHIENTLFGPDSTSLYIADDLEAPSLSTAPRNGISAEASVKKSTAELDAPCRYPLMLTCPLLTGSNAFTSTILFWEQLSTLSRDLVPFTKQERTKELKQRIPEIKKRFLPSSCIYAPVSNIHHRVWSIAAEECFAFSTKTRAPMFVCLEVVDYHSISSDVVAKPPSAMRQSWVNGLKRVMSEVGGSLTLNPTRDEAGCRQDGNDSDCDSDVEDDVATGGGITSNTPSGTATLQSDYSDRTQHKQDAAGQWSGTRRKSSAPLVSNSSDHSPTESSKLVLGNDDSDAIEYRQRASVSRDSMDQVKSCSPLSHLGDQPLVVFKERWRDKERRLRSRSGVGNLPGYRLLPVIVKTNDDLRQEEIAAQLLFLMNQILIEGDVPCWLRPYGIIAMSPDSGLIEAIPDTVSMDVLRRSVPNYTTLRAFFETFFGPEGSVEFTKARDNFVKSLAPYCIVCYLLNLKDRHNGNILLDRKGHVMHIDFGFIFGISPGGNIGFESAPFKLTAEFVELMDGPHSPLFHRFRDICVKTFMELRKHHYRIALILEMISVGNEHLPCFAGDPGRIIDEMRKRFVPHINDQAATEHVHNLINESIDNWTTSCYDRYQKCFVGVF